MREYHKIQSIFKRNPETKKFIEGQWSLPEFEYLQNNRWILTEKVDGTNIRIGWTGEEIKFGGRTENAQIPVFLYDKLRQIFKGKEATFIEIFGDWNTPPVGEMSEVVLFGEGYGAKIQKGGGNYNPTGVDFVLFDVCVGSWWLKREAVENVAEKLELRVVPIVGIATLPQAVGIVKNRYLKSAWGNFLAEGLVLRPEVELQTRGGVRIITKVKHKDFE